MTALFPLAWGPYLHVFYIFLRFVGIFMMVPAFSHKSVPILFKILFALSLAFAFYPLLKGKMGTPSSEISSVAAFVLREISFGFLMGFIIYITFEGIHLAAQFIGYQIGFGTIGLMDPITQTQVSVMVPLIGWTALMVFFFTNMHHEVIRLFVLSFEVTEPLNNALESGGQWISLIIKVTTRLFVIAIKIATPITLLVLCCNAAVGILARMLPQMNIILFTFPITILLGIVALYLLAPEFLAFFENTLKVVWEDLALLLRTV